MSGASPDTPANTDPRTASAITLPYAADAAGAARAYLRRQANLLHPPMLDDALILTSELVTNAIRHGRPAVTLAIHLEPSALTVVVTDTGPERPRWYPVVPTRTAPPDEASSSSTHLATRWGITPQPANPGKAVWFALDLHQRRPRPG